MKQWIKRVRSIERVSDLLDELTLSRLRRVSFWLLFILVMTPVYAMARSLFFEHHTEEAYLGNLLAIGRVWQLLIRQLGYLGLIIAVILIAKAFLKKKRRGTQAVDFLKAHSVETFMIGFLILAFLSTLYSPNRSLAWNGAFYRREGFETYLAYAGLFSMALTQNKKTGLLLMQSFIGVAFILTLFSFIDSPYLNNILTLSETSSIFHNANHFGYYLLMALMVNFVVLLHQSQYKKAPLAGFTVSFALMTLILITNRTFGVFLALILGFLISLCMIFWLKRSFLRRAFLIILLFISVSVLSSMPIDYLSSEGSHLSEDVGSVISGSEDSGNAGSGRWSLWTTGLMFAGERPLLGYGPDNLGERYSETGHSTDRPHNELIQFMASLGVPATLLYIGAVIALASQAFKHRKTLSIETLGLGFAVIAYLISSMFGNTMFYTTPFYLMIFALTYQFITIDKDAFKTPQSI